MIITISGYDGVGKSTSVKLLGEKLCEIYGGTCTSIYDVNSGSEVYEDLEQLNIIYDKLKEYDIIITRFYMRSKSFQEMQEKIMYTDTDIFNRDSLVREIVILAREEAELWYMKVIKKLLNKNKIIIYDRYWYDEVAYRSLYNLPKQFIEDLYIDYIKPDLKIFLYGDLTLIKQRNRGRIDMRTALFSSEKKMFELLENLDELCLKYDMKKIDVKSKTKYLIVDEIVNFVTCIYKKNREEYAPNKQ